MADHADNTDNSDSSVGAHHLQQGLIFNPGSTTTVCVLDTEATGLSAAYDRLVEVAAIDIVIDNTTGTYTTLGHYHQLINPKRAIDPEATRVHGHTAQSLEKYPAFKKIAVEFLKFVSGKFLLIHNATYDVGMINAELKRQKLGTLQDHVAGIIDTLPMARTVRPHLKNTLDALCDHYSIDRSIRTLHGALIDCELLAAVSVPLLAEYRAVVKPRLELLGFDPYGIDYTQAPADLIPYYARLLALQGWVNQFLGPLKETIIKEVCLAAGVPLNPNEVLKSFVVPVDPQFEIAISLRTSTDHAGVYAEFCPDVTSEQLEPFRKRGLACSLRKVPFKKRGETPELDSEHEGSANSEDTPHSDATANDRPSVA